MENKKVLAMKKYNCPLRKQIFYLIKIKIKPGDFNLEYFLKKLCSHKKILNPMRIEEKYLSFKKCLNKKYKLN